MKFSLQIWLKSGEHIDSEVRDGTHIASMSQHADQLRDRWGDLTSLTIEKEDGDIVLIPKENIETITFVKEE
jgi:hypothetical protein